MTRPTASGQAERVLVVGGNGFIGSHIVDALLSSGRSVRVLAPQQEIYRAPNPMVDYRFGRLDLGARIESAIEECDVVVDAVAMAVPSSANQSPSSAIAGAIGASAWLAELCLNSKSVKTHVYLSSGGTVYGRSAGNRAHVETDQLAPIGAYGALKAGSEIVLGGMLNNSHIRGVCLRVSNAYGERQNPARPQGIVAVAMSKLRTGQALTLFGNTVRDFIHASDVASAVVRSLEVEVSGPMNIGSGVGISIAALITDLERIARQSVAIQHHTARPFDVPHSVLDIDKARRMGWEPQIPLDEGLRRTWEWFGSQA